MFFNRYALIIYKKNPENLRELSSLKYILKHFISILTDFMTCHKITFYSKFDDIDDIFLNVLHMIKQIYRYIGIHFD